LRSGRLLESANSLTPVVVGVLRPTAILPAAWRTSDANTRHAVLAQEFAHLRRGDVLVSALARSVQCVFWFQPLAWRLAKDGAISLVGTHR
jgi:bla regulator protein blaR1